MRCYRDTIVKLGEVNSCCYVVTVPPDIVDEGTSSDITVQEGDNATLVCKAKGHPMPRIVWRREDGESIVIKKGGREVIRGT